MEAPPPTHRCQPLLQYKLRSRTSRCSPRQRARLWRRNRRLLRHARLGCSPRCRLRNQPRRGMRSQRRRCLGRLRCFPRRPQRR